MAQDPQQLKDEIARQREQVNRDLEAIGDHVLPGRVAERTRTKVRRRLHDVRDRVMGTAEDATSSTGDAIGSAGDAVTGAAHRVGHQAQQIGHQAQQIGEQIAAAPQVVTSHTQGNPIAAGMVAFGAGLLLAALLPTSEAEQELADRIAPSIDEARELAQGTAQDAAQHVVADLREPVQEAVEDVKERAAEAAGTVADQARGGLEDVADSARGATDDVARAPS